MDSARPNLATAKVGDHFTWRPPYYTAGWLFVRRVTVDDVRRVVECVSACASIGGGSSYGTHEETHRADCTGCEPCAGDCGVMSCACCCTKGERAPLCNCARRCKGCGRISCECSQKCPACGRYVCRPGCTWSDDEGECGDGC